MIIVVADDFTGASEMAGIALEHGLDVRIQTQWNFIAETCEVLVIDTNSRSLDHILSAEVMDQVMRLVQAASPDLLFKKTDSVLRGNIKEELETVLKFNPGKSVLLVPANPSMGRTIHDGIYYVEGAPIHESVFSRDPECPAMVSDVVQLIDRNRSGNLVKLISAGQSMESGSIYIPAEINDPAVPFWAKHLQGNIIAAGAADFFRAVLWEIGKRPGPLQTYRYDFSSIRSFIVCGSSLSDVDNIRSQMQSVKPAIVEIGENACFDKSSGLAVETAEIILREFDINQSVILMVSSATLLQDDIIRQLPTCLAEVVHTVLGSTTVQELFIEGGTSSSVIVRKLGWNGFEPTHVIGDGIIRMNVPVADIHLTVKPGSYHWPEDMWMPKNTEKKLPKPH